MLADGPILPPDPWDGNVMLADGPILPPDPWDGNVMLADGPILPPDPWDGNVMLADGPILPPDPWDGNVMLADGPILPPDPWDGNVMLADGPILPPDPWDGNVMLADGPILPPDLWDGNVMLADGPISRRSVGRKRDAGRRADPPARSVDGNLRSPHSHSTKIPLYEESPGLELEVGALRNPTLRSGDRASSSAPHHWHAAARRLPALSVSFRVHDRRPADHNSRCSVGYGLSPRTQGTAVAFAAVYWFNAVVMQTLVYAVVMSLIYQATASYGRAGSCAFR